MIGASVMEELKKYYANDDGKLFEKYTSNYPESLIKFIKTPWSMCLVEINFNKHLL